MLNYYFNNLINKIGITLFEPKYIYRQMKSRLLGYFSYKFLQGVSLSLNEVTILLTFNCNLKCPMCPQWGNFGLCKNYPERFLKESLSVNEWEDFVSSISPSLITLSGGEPLLYPHWYELAKYIKDKKINLTFITNGILLENYFTKIAETIDNLNISLDGVNKINDKIRGEGNFEKVLSGIRLLAEEKKKRKRRKPYIYIACTIGEENYNHLKEIVQFWEEFEVKVDTLVFQHLMFTNEENLECQKKEWQKRLKEETIFWEGSLNLAKNLKPEILSEQIKEIKERKNKIRVIFQPDFNYYETNFFYAYPAFLPPRFSKKCLAAWQQAIILPYGEVWICPDYSLGNIKTENFKEIWNNERAKYLRRNLKSQIFPACRSCCYLYSY